MSHTALTIPQPCPESWDAMTPTSTGRHCAACQKTVVDFTLKTDAEILAYLAGAAARGRTCGRFAAGQLGRPLQRAAPAAPAAGRWRAWLAAAVAVWGLREGIRNEAAAQAPTEWRARYWGGPVPAAPAGGTGETKGAAGAGGIGTPHNQIVMGGIPIAPNPFPAHLEPLAAPALVLRGIITDFSSAERLPGVTILVKGTPVGVSTNTDGTFALAVPAGLVSNEQLSIVIHYLGYATQEHSLSVINSKAEQHFKLQAQTMGAFGPRPWPWHPRTFYDWAKYQLTRPFRH